MLQLKKIVLICFICFCLMAGCFPAVEPVVRTHPANKHGIHLLLDDGRSQWAVQRWVEHIEFASQVAGADGYVTQLIRFDDLDGEKWQIFFDLCKEFQLIPIIRLATTFDHTEGYWVAPLADGDGRYHTVAQEYADFLTTLDWPTEEHLIVVGNEPNHGNEWSGRPDPAAYARFLIDVASAVHKADPNAKILNAGFDTFTPNTGSQPFIDGMFYVDAETFIQQMIIAEPAVFTHLDGWSSHPYPLGPFSQPPWEQTFQVDWLNDGQNPNHQLPPPRMHNRGINSYEWELWLLAQYGITDLPVYITETGWRHSIDGYPTAETAAVYFDLAWYGNSDGRYPDFPGSGWVPWADDPRVVAVTPFALNGNPAEWTHTNWLVMGEDGSILGETPLFKSMEQ